MTRRYGKFTLPGEWVRRGTSEVTRIMGMCCVFRAEYLMLTDVIEYQVSCWRFREVREGEIVPTYVWIMDDDGSVDCAEVAP